MDIQKESEMNIKEIDKLADECGLGLCMYDRPRMALCKITKTVIYKASGKLTPYGENLVKFANEIEKAVNNTKL